MTETQTSATGIEFVRTPDERFAELSGFPLQDDRGEDIAAALIEWKT